MKTTNTELFLDWSLYPVRSLSAVMACLVGAGVSPALANPSGGTVVQGSASFSSSGNNLTIKTSNGTQINWSSFNIGAGETTTFVEPSSSSVVWNKIDSSSGVSSILGSLKANGYVVLENASGFYVGGNASISTHGLVMTTSSMSVPDLSSSSAWQFNALPPSASIINYGKITTDGATGNGIYLIAADIENKSGGSLTAQGGTIGLYSGKEVLVTSRSDGRGLSAKVTLPSGSVDNQGNLIADAGTIAVNAATVNQGGLVEANSVNQANGVIELVASDSLTLGSSSTITAQGDSTSGNPSQGGCVVLKSAAAFSDATGSSVNVAGQNSGKNGIVEVFGTGITKSTLNSTVDGSAAAAFQSAGGLLLFNPLNLTLSTSASTPTAASPNLQLSYLSGFSKIDLFANNNITLSGSLTLADSSDTAAQLSLNAGNNITLSSGASLSGGANWSFDLSAGRRGLSSAPASGTDTLSLSQTSYIQTQNGDIDIYAAESVLISTALSTTSGIRTLGGGSIDVTAQYGDVNTGGNYNGFNFKLVGSSYYSASRLAGGISTVAGGDVSITAGGNVTSYLPTQTTYVNALNDAGCGAFGPEAGNVTITAGGNVYGHFVLANGVGTIMAGGDIGSLSSSKGFALSLIDGSWNVSTPNGSIYVQDVRNPNGIFNTKTTSGYLGQHLFDYSDDASVSLSAGNLVEITGTDAPHTGTGADNLTVPLIFPGSLTVNAGSGGFVLAANVTLFPSPQGELSITTTGGGNFQSVQSDSGLTTVYELSMSDSSSRRYTSSSSFSDADVSAVPVELNNPNPVQINISGNIENVYLHTTKATQVTVDGDTYNFNFKGQNLHTSDDTFVHVAGSVTYPDTYSFVDLNSTILSANSAVNGSWDTIFSLMVNTDNPIQVGSNFSNPAARTQYILNTYRLLLTSTVNASDLYSSAYNPGFVYYYNTSTKSWTLGFSGVMNSAILSALDKGSITIFKVDSSGNIMVDASGRVETEKVSFVPASQIETLYAEALKSNSSEMWGLQVGGPGQFAVRANSIDLNGSDGILSWGIYKGCNVDYSGLTGLTPAGAMLSVDTTGELSLLTACVASIYGGDVVINSGGAINLSQGDLDLSANSLFEYNGSGIYSSGNSAVTVTAQGDINIGSSRIASFNGGDLTIQSLTGDVNAGNGVNECFYVPVLQSAADGSWTSSQMMTSGSGIMAILPQSSYRMPGNKALPGNITVDTPEGDIISTLGGIEQVVLGGNVGPGATIDLTAGSEGHSGNVDLGDGGVVGGNINITANGDIRGLIIASQNADIKAAENFSGTLLASGSANVTATAGLVSGTVIGVGSATVNGGGGVSADVQGQNVSIGGGVASSTLGNGGSASATSQAAAQQATADTQQQLASNSGGEEDDQEAKKNKKGGRSPGLSRRVGRVTVILPPQS